MRSEQYIFFYQSIWYDQYWSWVLVLVLSVCCCMAWAHGSFRSEGPQIRQRAAAEEWPGDFGPTGSGRRWRSGTFGCQSVGCKTQVFTTMYYNTYRPIAYSLYIAYSILILDTTIHIWYWDWYLTDTDTDTFLNQGTSVAVCQFARFTSLLRKLGHSSFSISFHIVWIHIDVFFLQCRLQRRC